MDTRLEQAGGRRRRTRRVIAGAAVAAIVGGATLVATAGPASGSGWEASAVLRDVEGDKVGVVRFDGNSHGTTVRVKLHGVAAGLDAFHGFHIHANDAGQSCDPAAPGGPFNNVGGHWNPSTPPAAHANHDGDMPSMLVGTGGGGEATFRTGRFDPAEIEGRAVILHAGPDNFGNIPSRYSSGTPPVPGADSTTLLTGDAGGRYACGIIR